MNLKLGPYIRTAKNVITANSPTLLVGAAVAGIISTGYFAARGGYKARGIIEAEEAKRRIQGEGEKEAPLDTMEKVKLTWLCYAAPGVTAISSILSVVGVHVIHTKRANAMAALYAVASGKLDTLGDEAEKLLGPKKAQDLQNNLSQKAVDDADNFVNDEVIMTGEGKELCFDEWTGRWFMSNLNIIQNAAHEINMHLVEGGEAPLNDFYEYLGLEPVPMGTDFGWSGEKITVKTGSVKTGDGHAALSVFFRPAPKPKLGRL